jgi:O-Antigen ligase
VWGDGELSYPPAGVASAARARPAARADAAGFGLGAVGVLGLGAAHGGYFPTAWGWAVVAFVAMLVWSLTVGAVRRPTALEGVFLGALLAFACWFALSSTWGTVSAAIDEAVRALVYVAGAAVALSIVRRATVHAFLAGVLTATTALACYALASRLFPDRIGTFDSVAAYRLSTPIGYWNALGLLCALGVLVAVGLAASTSSPARAAFAAAPVPILLTTLYFTFSRGSFIALGIGLVVAIALDPRRIRLTATALTAGVPAALGVLACSRSVPLTNLQSTVARAAHDGHRLALLLLAFVVASAALTAALVLLRSVTATPPVVSRVYPIALLAAAVIAVAFAVVHLGGPSAAARRTWHSFAATPPKPQADLRKRLFNFSGTGRVPLFKAALHDAEGHLIIGSGAGSYEAYWLAHRTIGAKVRDSHSLYLETLAEGGIVGLAILLLALGAPLVAAVRARKRRGVAAATGAYVAYLAGAAVDWDWEITSVTLAAIFVGVALLASARSDDERQASPMLRYSVLGVALAIGTVGFVFLVGNMFLWRASSAASDAKWVTAARDAQRAASWLPWSTEPWQQLGEAQLAQGQVSAAQASFRTAIRKDTGDWNLWFDLARATTGKTQLAALAQATRLDPLSPEIAIFRSDLGSQLGISITAGAKP